MKPISERWEFEDKNIKKLMYEHFQKHFWVTLNRFIAVTSSTAYFVDNETHEIIQTFELGCA